MIPTSAISQLAVAIFVWFAVLFGTGNSKYIWNLVAQAQSIAMSEVKGDWGCPSLYDRDACRRYQPHH